MKVVKRIFRVYKKYNPEETIFGYLKRHIGQVFLALCVSLPIATFLCFDAFHKLYEKHGKDFWEVFYTDQFDDVVWGFFFIWLPIALGIFMMFRFAGDPKEERLIKRKENSLLSQWILLFAVILSGGILRIGQKEIHGVVTDFIKDASPVAYLKFLSVVLLLTFGTIWEKFILWLKRGEAYKNPWVMKSLLCTLASILGFLLLELQIGTPAQVNVRMLFFNLMYWTIVYGFFYALFRGIKLPAFLTLSLAYFFGFMNYVVVQFRGNYVMYGDLTVIGTAMVVADRYKFKPDFPFYITAILFLFSLVTIFFVPRLHSARIGIVRRGMTTLIGLGLMGILVLSAYQSEILYNGIFGLSWDYNKNVREHGYLPYFLSNFHETASVRVEGYQAEEVEEIIRRVNSAEDSITKEIREEAERFPTIIVIQNETFADLSVLADVKTDKPVMPYIDSLKKNTRKGYLNMSVTGGPTANTEFEFLARSSMIFMPTGSVPYTQYLKQNIPSIVEMLKNQKKPYKTTAFHPYYSSGYNRKSVYQYMGFDEAIFYEDFTGKELLRGLQTDADNYKDLIAMYEKNKKENPEQPQFFFNVTMQNHGGFSNNKVRFDTDVKITSFDSVQALDNFVSLMRTSDTALIKFLDYFSKVDEEVIVLFYGDHQPAFSEDATKQLEEHSRYKTDQEIKLSKYIVPYFIWANYDIPESDAMHEGALTGEYNVMSINYIASELLKYSGVKLTEYDKFLLNLHEKIPAMTALGYWDKEGKHYEREDESELTKWKEDYEKVQYNLFFDKKNKKWRQFLPNFEEVHP